MHEKVRHSMTSLFCVCPPSYLYYWIDCEMCLNWYIGHPPLPFFLMMSNLLYFLYLWLFDSVSLKKDLFFQRAHVQSTRRSNQEKTRPPTRWTSDPIKTSTLLLNFPSRATKSLSPMTQTWLWFFFWIFLKKILWFSIFSFFQYFESICVGRETVPPLRSMTVTDDDSFERLIFKGWHFLWLMIFYFLDK